MVTKLVKREIGETHVALHSQVRAVQLQDETSRDNRLVLIAHRVRESVEIGLLSRIIGVLHDLGNSPRRGRGQKGLFWLYSSQRGSQIRDIVMHSVLVTQADGAGAGRDKISTSALVAPEHRQIWMVKNVSRDQGL